MSPHQIKIMSTVDLRSTLALYRELQSKSTVDILIEAYIENELHVRQQSLLDLSVN